MHSHLTNNQHTEKFSKLGKKIRIIFALVVVLGVMAMVLVIFRGTQWLYNNSNETPVKNSQVNVIAKLKEYFAGNNDKQDNNDKTRIFGSNQVVAEENAVINVVKNSSPAVVSIIASAEVPRVERCFRRDDFGIPGFGFDIPSFCENGTELRRVGAGTGYIVSTDGYIITNKHVVADVDAEYTVVLNDQDNLGKKIDAKVLARHPENDIAVLKIKLKELPYLSLGDSDSLQIGQTAIAIGYALGEFDNTVSKGVISGLSRNIEAGGRSGVESLRGLIQTDAAINLGNSGGPLLNLSGQVIGMNTAVASGQGIGFAIPINLVNDAYKQVLESGTIIESEKGFLGVRYTPISRRLQELNNLPYDYGMLVVRGDTREEIAVVPGSPADKAGITENDIILEVDNKQLNERFLLVDAIQDKGPGDIVELLVYQKGEEKRISVELAKRK